MSRIEELMPDYNEIGDLVDLEQYPDIEGLNDSDTEDDDDID